LFFYFLISIEPLYLPFPLDITAIYHIFQVYMRNSLSHKRRTGWF